MIRIDFNENCTLPAVDEPSIVTWQIKEMKNTSTGESVINSFKRAYRDFKVDEGMNIYERDTVYDSMKDARNETEPEVKWVESSISFEAEMIGTVNNYFYTYEITADDGKITSFELISKRSE